jgi:dephospho-CoA kinase
MIVAGLTGSIAMGKSEQARMFREAGVPVFDADATVHRLYAEGGKAVPLIARRFPEAVAGGAVDRQVLARLVLDDPAAMRDLEIMVHPLVWAEEKHFIQSEENQGSPLVIIDNPLLLEKGRDAAVDVVIVVSAPAEIQRERALKRPGMTEAKLNAILAKQMPDAEKRARADFVIDTSLGLEHANRQVLAIIRKLRDRNA